MCRNYDFTDKCQIPGVISTNSPLAPAGDVQRFVRENAVFVPEGSVNSAKLCQH